MSLKQLRFDQDDIENALASMRPEEIDQLPFGAIQMDDKGTILYYSVGEAKISNRDPEKVTGKNFFQDVAPCTRTPEFEGRFRALVETGESTVFEYTFDYRMNPTRVRVHMKKALVGDTYWVLVNKL